MAKQATPPFDDRSLTKDELKQVERANQSENTPVVFVHGLWLLSSSWDRWAKLNLTRFGGRLSHTGNGCSLERSSCAEDQSAVSGRVSG